MIVPTYEKMIELETMIQKRWTQGFKIVAADGASVDIDHHSLANLFMAFEARFFNQVARAELHKTAQGAVE